MASIVCSVRMSAGLVKKLSSASSVPMFQRRFLNVDVTAVPPFPDLHDYPYKFPVASQESLIRRGTQFNHRQVEIRTCGTLYQKWRQENRYWTVPEAAVPFTVDYLDTKSRGSKEDGKPVVVILHGSPGSYDNFTHLTEYLHRHDVRVIVPCFPGLSTFRMGRFRHTPEEKCEYVKDFLRGINAPKVDMLICHSSSLFPGVLLCKEKQFPIGSLTLLNPTAYHWPRVLKPFSVVKHLSRMFEFPGVNQVASAVGAVMVMSKPQLKGNNISDHFLSAFTMMASEVPKRKSDFEEVLQSQMPVMLAFSENDKLIGKRALYEMAEMMVRGTEVQKYDGSGKLLSKGGDNPSRRVLSFSKGTHFVFQKHPDVVAEQVRSFLFNQLEKR